MSRHEGAATASSPPTRPWRAFELDLWMACLRTAPVHGVGGEASRRRWAAGLLKWLDHHGVGRSVPDPGRADAEPGSKPSAPPPAHVGWAPTSVIAEHTRWIWEESGLPDDFRRRVNERLRLLAPLVPRRWELPVPAEKAVEILADHWMGATFLTPRQWTDLVFLLLQRPYNDHIENKNARYRALADHWDSRKDPHTFHEILGQGRGLLGPFTELFHHSLCSRAYVRIPVDLGEQASSIAIPVLLSVLPPVSKRGSRDVVVLPADFQEMLDADEDAHRAAEAESDASLEDRRHRDDAFVTGLRRGWDAAALLWLSQHRAWPSEIQEWVERGSLEVDFGMTAAAAAGLSDILGFGPEISLHGGSAGLPVALHALALLCDGRPRGVVVATGRLEAPPVVQAEEAEDDVETPDSVDAPMTWDEWIPSKAAAASSGSPRSSDTIACWPEQVEDHQLLPVALGRKLQAAATFGAVERFISTDRTSSGRIDRDISGVLQYWDKYLPVTAVRSLREAADLVIGPNWRRFRFVRAPELMWRFSGPVRISHYMRVPVGARPEIDAIMRSGFADCTVACIRSSSSAEAGAAVVHALLRHCRGLSHHRAPWPTMLYMRVAADSDEHGDRFWRAFFEELEIEVEVAQSFHSAASWGEKARVLATALNDVSPSWSARARCGPALIVVEGVEHAVPAAENIVVPAQDPYHVHEILRRVLPQLKPVGSPGLSTRLLLVSGPASSVLDWDMPQIDLLGCRDAPLQYEPAPNWSLADLVGIVADAVGERRGSFAQMMRSPAIHDALEILARAAVFRHGFTLEALRALFADVPDGRWRPGACAIFDIHAGWHRSSMPEPLAWHDYEQILEGPLSRFPALADHSSLIRRLQESWHLAPAVQAAFREALAEVKVTKGGEQALNEVNFRAALFFAPALHGTLRVPAGFPELLGSQALRAVSLAEARFHVEAARDWWNERSGQAYEITREDLARKTLAKYFEPHGLARARGLATYAREHQNAAAALEDWVRAMEALRRLPRGTGLRQPVLAAAPDRGGSTDVREQVREDETVGAWNPLWLLDLARYRLEFALVIRRKDAAQGTSWERRALDALDAADRLLDSVENVANLLPSDVPRVRTAVRQVRLRHALAVGNLDRTMVTKAIEEAHRIIDAGPQAGFGYFLVDLCRAAVDFELTGEALNLTDAAIPWMAEAYQGWLLHVGLSSRCRGTAAGDSAAREFWAGRHNERRRLVWARLLRFAGRERGESRRVAIAALGHLRTVCDISDEGARRQFNELLSEARR